jgi:hypothetical protein
MPPELSGLSEKDLFDLIVGTGLPLLIAFIQQPRWSDSTRAVVAALVCILVALGTTYYAGQFTGTSVAKAIMLILLSAWASYQNFWKQTIAPKIEAATSPK